MHTYSPLFYPSYMQTLDSQTRTRTYAIEQTHANLLTSLQPFLPPFNPLVHSEQFFILVEFASGGNLLSYLKQMRKDRQTMSWSKGLGFALQIANGMAHLADKEVRMCTYVCTYIHTYDYFCICMYVCMYIRRSLAKELLCQVSAAAIRCCCFSYLCAYYIYACLL